ncbi:MAG: hypothetical protein ACFFBH_11005 [Promethearchaeota archaeon]
MSKRNRNKILIVFFVSLLTLFIVNTFSLKIAPLKDFNQSTHRLSTSDTLIPNDLVICNATNDQGSFKTCSDGSGGMIIAWCDHRNGVYTDIYAQRFNSTGDIKWALNGVPICTADLDQSGIDICSDGVGGAIIAWTDERNGDQDVYAQRINANGNVMWDYNGICICNALDVQYFNYICSDGHEGAIITWMDNRNSFYSDVYAQRVNSTGDIQWNVNGIPICTANEFQRTVGIESDENGGGIIIWQDERSGVEDIYGQRVAPNGSILWDFNGKAICTQAYNQYVVKMCSDNQGGIFLAWQNWWSPLGRYAIYAQWVNSSGDIQWAPDGNTICYFSGFDGNRGIPDICVDGNGGALIAWPDSRGWISDDIYVQKVNSSGDIQWTPNGTPVCTAESNQDNARVCNDGNGGAIIIWSDFRNNVDSNIYAQRISSTGDPLWTFNGQAICILNETQQYPQIYEDGFGGAIMIWEDLRNGVDLDIYAQRVNSTGDIQWVTKTMNGNNGEVPNIPFGNYFVIIVIISSLALAYFKKKQLSIKKAI